MTQPHLWREGTKGGEVSLGEDVIILLISVLVGACPSGITSTRSIERQE
jgi:hypothetical protein